MLVTHNRTTHASIPSTRCPVLSDLYGGDIETISAVVHKEEQKATGLLQPGVTNRDHKRLPQSQLPSLTEFPAMLFLPKFHQ